MQKEIVNIFILPGVQQKLWIQIQYKISKEEIPQGIELWEVKGRNMVSGSTFPSELLRVSKSAFDGRHSEDRRHTWIKVHSVNLPEMLGISYTTFMKLSKFAAADQPMQ